jgi:hypothetical protein
LKKYICIWKARKGIKSCVLGVKFDEEQTKRAVYKDKEQEGMRV